MKRKWLLSVLAGCLVMGMSVPLFASAGGSGGKKHSASHVQKRLMFKEKHKETYFNGKPKVFGIIAQVCDVNAKYKNRYICPPGAKQTHVKHGTWKWWWSNGKLMAVRHYHLGHLVGESRAWFASGKKRWVEHHNKAGQRNGLRIEWFTSGTKKRQERFKNGKRHGTQILWWSNGAKASQGQYAFGRRTGAWEHWYINGDIKEVINYSEGKRHGAYALFRSICQPSGCASVKSVEGQYKDGNKDGKWTRWYFDAEGKKKSKLEIWKNGQRTL